MEYQIDFIWDDEAAVWIATSNDIAGLVLGSDSLDMLMERVRNAANELLLLNNMPVATSFKYVCSRTIRDEKDDKNNQECY